MIIGNVYIINNEHLRLVKKRSSGVYTFLQVDSKNNPIVKKRSWSTRPEEQLRIKIVKLRNEQLRIF